MRFKSLFSPLFFISITLISCEFHCSVGSKDEPVQKTNTPVHKEGATFYNGIDIVSNKIKVNKAYLRFKSGERVPEDNFVDFLKPVQVVIYIDSGWVEQHGRVWIDASEKIEEENGTALMNKESMLGENPEGVPVTDAKLIWFIADIKRKENAPPGSYKVSFRVWDKKGDEYIEGSYKLYSK